jgi:hypothetical protein
VKVNNEHRPSRFGWWFATKHDLERLEYKIMSAIIDAVTAVQGSLDAVSTQLDTIVAGISALDVLITNFQNSPGTLTPADQAALDSIQASSKALLAKANAVVTTPPAPPVA